MRRITLGLGLGALLLASGCSGFNDRTHVRNDAPPFGRGQKPTAQALVSYLNANARRIPALTAADVTLEAKGEGGSGVVSGRLDCQKPRYFRLTGNAVGERMVDFGSNDQEFWYWIAQDQSRRIYHCDYEDLPKVRMPFPFQPETILAALGMAEYDPNKQYEVRDNGKTIELIESSTTPQGQPVKRITVFNRRRTSAEQPLVSAYIIRDQNNRDICAAHIDRVQTDPRSGAVVPHRLRIVWPAQKLELKMRLDELRIGPLDRQLAASIFSRPEIVGFQTFDLANPPAQVQRITNPPR